MIKIKKLLRTLISSSLRTQWLRWLEKAEPAKLPYSILLYTNAIETNLN